MIKAIIFDCFGVLTTDGWLPFKEKYFQNDADRYQQATDLNKQVDSGLMDFTAFTLQVAQLAGIEQLAALHAIENNVTNRPLFEYIEAELKPQFKLGILSNAGANWLNEMFAPAEVALFDAVALSYETGVIKPDPRAYEAIAAKLSVEPEECIFIDDQERFCTAATEVGMSAIHYTSVAQLKTALPPLLS